MKFFEKISKNLGRVKESFVYCFGLVKISLFKAIVGVSRRYFSCHP